MTNIDNRKEYFDLDEVLETEIKFGKYQIIQFLLIAFPIFLNGVYSAYIFTAGTLNYRCKVPECESPNKSPSYLTDWVNLTTPYNKDSGLPEKCERFAPVTEGLEDADTCAVESFNQSAVVKCSEFVYEDEEVTILNAFNLNCDKEFYLSLIGTINNVGQLFCYLVTGVLSDRYGRKFVLILGCFGSGLFGILRIFSWNYPSFAVFEFLDALFGAATYSTAYIIGLELVTPRFRTVFGTLLNCFYAFGEIYVGLIAMWFRNYKIILLILYAPSMLILSYMYILPQSIRWLIMKGNYEEAKKILVQASRINKTSLSDTSSMILDEKPKLRDSEEDISSFSGSKRSSTIQLVLLIANISYLWFATIFVYFGLNINSVYLEYWDKYISYIVVCLIELPSYFITNFLMEKIGRKKTLFLGMIGSGVFCIVSEFIAGSMLKTICFVIGKLLITISFSCLYIFTIEVFPTNLRHRFFSICSVVGRIGSILTPLTPILAQEFSPRLPLIIFSALSFSSAIFLCALPETLNRKLPENVDQALS